MNRLSKILVSVCIILSISPAAIRACPPDCGDCEYFDEYTQQCVYECEGCCSCFNDSCENVDYYCDACEYCTSCGCECAVFANLISGISGPYAIGDSTTVSASTSGSLPSGCSIDWSGDASFEDISGTSATAVFNTAGTGLQITAATSCQARPVPSAQFDVIDVAITTPSSYPVYIEFGGSVQLDCTPEGPTDGSYSWSPGTVTFSPSANIKNPTFSANQSGNYTASVSYSLGGATVGDTSGTINVVRVTSVVATADYASVGQNVTFGAVTHPLNCGSLVTVTWSGGQNPATGSGSQWTTNWGTPGTKIVSATCGTSSAQKDVQVFANPVAILHYSASTYIGRGETIYFDGSGSFDPDGGGGGTFRGIKKFQWDWDNNGVYDYEENPGIGITSHLFTTGGTKTVTMRVTDNDAAEGGPPDKSATDSVTFQVCTKPHVATLWKDTAWEDPDGVLVLIYRWLPTSGTVGDLDGLVGEIVEYPGGDPYQWPPPWNFATYNPTKVSVPASDGAFQDTHVTGNFAQPYQGNSFSASQKYGFHCNECMPSGLGMNLLGPHSISRQVYWVPPPDSTWRYKIEKTGESAEKNLPP